MTWLTSTSLFRVTSLESTDESRQTNDTSAGERVSWTKPGHTSLLRALGSKSKMTMKDPSLMKDSYSTFEMRRASTSRKEGRDQGIDRAPPTTNGTPIIIRGSSI